MIYIHYCIKFFASCLICGLILSKTLAITPEWATTKICTEENCAIGEASLKEGEMSAIARALKDLRLMLGANVATEYSENIGDDGQTKADSKLKVYASMQNIGYTILDRYQDSSNIYIKIQYDPNKKILPNQSIPEFSTIANLEKLCEDKKLDGYYCVILGNKYKHGENGLAINEDIALKYYKKSCDMGTLEGCQYAGEILMPNSTWSAKNYFKKACDNGLGSGCVKLAILEESITKKRDLYLEGCMLNDSLACAFLGEIYEKGLAHLAKDKNAALSYYNKSCNLNPNGDGCALFAELNGDTDELESLCHNHNARACAILGGARNDSNMLEESILQDSSLGYYFLAQTKSDFNTKQKMLEQSCNVGMQNDLTKACEELGDIYRHSDTEQSIQYYKQSCNHLFYEQSACEKLYEIAPKQCTNDICLAIKQKELQLEQERIAAAKEADNTKNFSQTTTNTDNQNIYNSKMGAFVDILVGLATIRFPELQSHASENSADIALSARIGVEFRANKTFSPFVAPYVSISGVYSQTIQLQKSYNSYYYYDDEDENKYSILLGGGALAGITYKSFKLFGIIEYGYNMASKNNSDNLNPLKSSFGYGVGIAYHKKMFRIGLQYLRNNYSYYGIKISGRRGETIALDTSKQYSNKSSAFYVFVGLGF